MTRAIEIYRGLCADLSKDEIRELAREVRAHYDELVQAQRQSELVAIDIAELLAARLDGLLLLAPRMSPEDRSLVVGAARYFVSPNDAVPDERVLTGLDDDVEVFNHVAALLEREDLLITE